LSGVRNTEFPYTIARDGAVVLETAGTGQNVQVGSIEVIPNAGTAAPDGAGVFRLVQNGVVVTESGVPAAQPSTHMLISIPPTATTPGSHSQIRQIAQLISSCLPRSWTGSV